MVDDKSMSVEQPKVLKTWRVELARSRQEVRVRAETREEALKLGAEKLYAPVTMLDAILEG